MIPFSMFDLFKAAKCKVDITTYDSLGIPGLKKNEYLYFLMGKLTAEGKNVEILSTNPILDNCKKILEKPVSAAKKKVVKAASSVKKTARKTVDKASEVVKEAPKKASEAKLAVKEKVTKKNTKADAKAFDEKRFDEQYDKLTAIIDEIPKTDDFNPSNQIYNIVTAVRMMGEQKLTFEKAIKQACSPLVADKLYAAIKSKKTAIVKIIKEMPEDEK